jgi:hypothetical protein
MNIRISLVALFASAMCSAAAIGADNVGKAKELFERYIALEQAFDPAQADLYADDAKIQNTRNYPGGEKRTLTIPAPKYKEMLRAAMPIAKMRGDTSSYSEVKYTAEGKSIRITATRFSNLKKYSSPFSLLVAPDKEGNWRILEELSESQP